jgi:predicted phosphoadenosine phosphosulfate sulfurtransferase
MSKKTIQERAQNFLKENEIILKKHGLLMQLVVAFAGKKQAPLLSRIALWFVAKQGGRLDIQFIDKEQQYGSHR